MNVNLNSFYQATKLDGDYNIGLQDEQPKTGKQNEGAQNLGERQIVQVDNPDANRNREVREALFNAAQETGGTERKFVDQLREKLGIGTNNKATNTAQLKGLEARKVVNLARAQGSNVEAMLNRALTVVTMPAKAKAELKKAILDQADHPDVVKFLATYAEGKRDLYALSQVCALAVQLDKREGGTGDKLGLAYLQGFSAGVDPSAPLLDHVPTQEDLNRMRTEGLNAHDIQNDADVKIQAQNERVDGEENEQGNNETNILNNPGQPENQEQNIIGNGKPNEGTDKIENNEEIKANQKEDDQNLNVGKKEEPQINEVRQNLENRVLERTGKTRQILNAIADFFTKTVPALAEKARNLLDRLNNLIRKAFNLPTVRLEDENLLETELNQIEEESEDLKDEANENDFQGGFEILDMSEDSGEKKIKKNDLNAEELEVLDEGLGDFQGNEGKLIEQVEVRKTALAKIQSFFKDTIPSLAQKAKDLFNELHDRLREFFTARKDDDEGRSKVLEALTALGEKIKGFFDFIAEKLKGKGVGDNNLIDEIEGIGGENIDLEGDEYDDDSNSDVIK